SPTQLVGAALVLTAMWFGQRVPAISADAEAPVLAGTARVRRRLALLLRQSVVNGDGSQAHVDIGVIDEVVDLRQRQRGGERGKTYLRMGVDDEPLGVGGLRLATGDSCTNPPQR